MKKQQRKFVALGLTFALAVSSLTAHQMNTQAATKKATAIKLNATSKKLTVGDTTTLKVKKVTPTKASKTVTWKTSNKKVATVSTKGKVTAKKVGTAKITAVSKSNKKVKAVCKITVKKKATATPTKAPASTAEPTATAPPIEGNILYSGAYKNTTWTIDKDGLLEVKGTGEVRNNLGYPGWYDHRNEIKSARIELTKVTNMASMFEGCKALTSLNLSNFDTSKVQNTYTMFSLCDNLTTIHTPKTSTLVVTELPEGTWTGSNGQTYTTLPTNATGSITLTKQ